MKRLPDDSLLRKATRRQILAGGLTTALSASLCVSAPTADASDARSEAAFEANVRGLGEVLADDGSFFIAPSDVNGRARDLAASYVREAEEARAGLDNLWSRIGSDEMRSSAVDARRAHLRTIRLGSNGVASAVALEVAISMLIAPYLPDRPWQMPLIGATGV